MSLSRLNSSVIVGSFSFVSALLLFPIWSAPGQKIIGSSQGDTYKHLWSFWHTLTEIGTWPWTTKLNTPHGGFLLDVMLTPALVMSPFSAILGPVWAANLFVFFSFIAIAGAMYWFCVQKGFSKAEALGAGILIQSFPYLLGYPFASGVYERLGCWIFPLLLVCFERHHKDGGFRWLLGAVLVLLFIAFSCQTYAVFAALLLALYFPVLWSRRAAVFLLLVAIALLGSFLFIRYVAQSPWTLSPQPMRFSLFAAGPMVEESTSLASLLSPFYVKAQRGVESGDWLLRLSYIGWIPLLLCGRALYQKKLSPYIIYLGALFLILSLGTKITAFSLSIPNPFYLLFAYTLPAYGSIPDSFQQVAVALPFVAMGTVAGLRGLSPKTGLFLFVLCFVERGLVLPHSAIWNASTTAVPSVYQKIYDGPVLDIPRQYKGKQLVSAAPFWYQTAHQQPIAFSVYMGVTGWDAYAPIAVGSSSDWNASARCMRKGGIRWLVIHKDWFEDPAQAARIRQQLSLQPVFDGEQLLYDLSSLSTSPMKDVYLPPRNTKLPEERPQEELLDVDIFSMQQSKCPIDSAAPHHQGPR